ncbi:Myrosinase 1 [Eumeta japonica]|uniref:beta-glucosidase n=1 Tax=Eumeta variegata TaxID=151549 RepID=A0A4C1UQ46_EUMVA|nr:Myrosinase 1 [Eumeta japonica]
MKLGLLRDKCRKKPMEGVKVNLARTTRRFSAHTIDEYEYIELPRSFEMNAGCARVSAQHTKFPEGFIFGVATAAHQIEGAWNVSGKGENVWDRFTHTQPEMVADLTNGDVAVDSYNRYLEDVEALEYLGVDFYRLSLSWARILPNGRIDEINPDGLRYYHALLDALAEKNIKPLVTLFHWDLPQKLQDLGGWANPELVDYFYDYSDLCFREFGDKIKSWITFNEPYEICEDAYGDILKAPGLNSHGVGNYLCSNTLLKAHAEAYHLYDQIYRPKQGGNIMISINSIWYEPSDPNNEEQVTLAETANQFKFGWFAHPIFTEEGGYPAQMVENVARQSEMEGLARSRLQQFNDYWIQRIKGTSDYLGINHYTTFLVTGPGVDPTAKSPSWLKDIGAVTTMEVGGDSASTWLRVYPSGFANLLRWCKRNYNDPIIFITENGFSDRGTLEDYGRISYYNDYLSEILNVIYNDDVNVIGYTAWTLMDNFEWRAGFSERFGFYYVNITDPNLPRTPKLSVEYFKQLIANRELPQDDRFKEPSLKAREDLHVDFDRVLNELSKPNARELARLGNHACPLRTLKFRSVNFGPFSLPLPQDASIRFNLGPGSQLQILSVTFERLRGAIFRSAATYLPLFKHIRQ